MSSPVRFFSLVASEGSIFRVSGEIGTVVARLVVLPDPDAGYLAVWPAYGVVVRTHYLGRENGGPVHQDIEVLGGEENYRAHETLIVALLSRFWLHQKAV